MEKYRKTFYSKLYESSNDIALSPPQSQVTRIVSDNRKLINAN